MLYLIIKAAVSGVLIALISEIARRSPGWGGLLASLPLTSLLAMIWLWRDTKDPLRVADLAASTMWFFVPSLPLFVVVPWMLRGGWGFWPTILVACALTIALYAGMVALAPRLGIRL